MENEERRVDETQGQRDGDSERLTTLVDEMLEAWHYTRDGVIAEARNLPPERFQERPAGVRRSPLELVNHIVESGWLMAGELANPQGDFQRRPYLDLLAEHSPAIGHAEDFAGALQALEQSYAEGAIRLRSAGPELLLEPIRQFNGVYATRLAWMHHGIAHEEYHRGQLALYARLFGETPALTKQILGGID